MKKPLLVLLIALFVLSAIVSCTNSEEENSTDKPEAESYTYKTLVFEKPKLWIETSDSSEDRMILESSDHNQEPTTVVISAISNLDMTPLEYANMVKEEFQIANEPEEMTFGATKYIVLRHQSQIPLYNFFFKFENLNYYIAYGNMNDEITPNAALFLSSIEHVK